MIERLRAFSSPPVLVGQVMEMVMILIGKRLPSQRIEPRDYGTGKEEMSSRMSSSSSGTKVVKKCEYTVPCGLSLHILELTCLIFKPSTQGHQKMTIYASRRESIKWLLCMSVRLHFLDTPSYLIVLCCYFLCALQLAIC